LALSDELGMFAHPRPAIRQRSEAETIDSIARLVAAEEVAEVFVGLPLTLVGGDSEQTVAARAFTAALRRALSVPVRECDERYSSVQATRSVKGAARRKSGEVDSAAAALILQSILDARRPADAR
jgi:putative Holliday junction resolvase